MSKELNISETIKKYRKIRNMNQKELADASGLSISTLKKYEANTRNPKPEQLQKIAEALQVSINAFMPLEVNDKSDLISALIQLDEETGLQWEFKRNDKNEIIPETIAITFADNDINKKLASYLTNKNDDSNKQETLNRLFTYSHNINNSNNNKDRSQE